MYILMNYYHYDVGVKIFNDSLKLILYEIEIPYHFVGKTNGDYWPVEMIDLIIKNIYYFKFKSMVFEKKITDKFSIAFSIHLQ